MQLRSRTINSLPQKKIEKAKKTPTKTTKAQKTRVSTSRKRKAAVDRPSRGRASSVEKKGYWVGPYGIRVSNSVGSIKAADGGNTLYRNGNQSEMFVENPISKEEYFKKHTIRRDGYRWWQ